MQYTKTCMRNQFLFCKKDAFQNKDFSRLNCQLKRKKMTEQVGKDFPSFRRRGNGLSKLVEFSAQDPFQIRACKTVSIKKPLSDCLYCGPSRELDWALTISC